jgi:hypothetical protein
MADDTSNKPYPFQFDPSQWSNPYSNFYGRALPFPPSYAGTPTNALGQPIQPQPGMTLNQTPAQPQAPAAAPQSNIPQFLPIGFGQGTGGAAGGQNAMGSPGQAVGGQNVGGGYQINPAYAIQQMQQQYAAQQAPQAAAPAAAPNNWQNTLSMLANPGHVTTPGATVPQAPTSNQPGPGVLQNFLANWQPASSGAGSGFTQNFNSILRGLQAQQKGS